MKALATIGWRKAIRFLAGEMGSLMLGLCVAPPLRVLLLRLFGARIGRNCVVHRMRFINFYRGTFRHLRLGDDCFVGEECLLDLAAPVRLGDQVTLAPRVVVLTHLNVGYPDHPLQGAFPAAAEAVTIGSGAFIGACSTVVGGATIGRGTFVSAGSVVAGSVPAGVLAGGVPARVIRELKEPGT